ncbi:NAD(P)H-dependent oxidoreductase, partial [Adlercreutzia equolifaciens]|uniref:NAD(P)H-dependent oxidoreductase n=1 Tax=Adlercreutzia equolifaciens TaxID=446660 RepID=UPI0026716CB7
MKVLLINGSPRWKGNTNRALEEAAAALEAEGVETELVWIGNKEIRGCIACGICHKTGDGRCVFGEDCCNDLILELGEVSTVIDSYLTDC